MLKAASLALLAWAISFSPGAPHPRPEVPSFERIDAHAHVFNSDPAFGAMLERLHMRILNICVVDKHDPDFEEAEPQHARALDLFHSSHGRAAWCSTFDPQDWETAGFAQKIISELNRTFDEGAIAVKIYKSIGMELKSKDGKYLMPDNPVFSPILEDIAAHHKTLFAHIAEPTSAWQPLDPASPDYSYYRDNPNWHMYLHPERPSKETIIAARDRMVKGHPKLRVVGCHLGSLEVDVDEIARRFDLYPNFAVDTAARIPYLMLQPREKVRAFLIKYQNRVLYGTDLEWLSGAKSDEEVKHWESEYERDWKFFATNEVVQYEGHQYRGLALPEPVLRKLFHDNAIYWVPGIVGR